MSIIYNRIKAGTPRQRAIILFCINIIIIICLIIATLILKYTNIRIKCVTYELIGIYCPGCGGTRMISHLLSGDIATAFKSNQLLFILIPYTILLYTYEMIVIIKTGKISKQLNKILIIIAFVMITYGMIRNIPLFSWLAPIGID